MPRPLDPRRTLRLEPLEDRATPATFTVNATGDAGTGTGTTGDLRYCVTQANNEVANPGPDTIVFDPSVAGQTFNLTAADPETLGTAGLIVTSNITVAGTGETIGRKADATNPFRLFNVTVTGNLTLANLTLTGGRSVVGGAISNDGKLTILNSTLIGNSTKGAVGQFVIGIPTPLPPGHGEGGAVYNNGGTLVIANTTITQNTAEGGDQGAAQAAGIGEGGGVYNFQGTATLTNVTIARNTVLNGAGASPGNPRGGALYDFSGTPGVTATVNLSNSILSNTTGGFSDVAAEGGGGAGPAVINTPTHNLISTPFLSVGGSVNGVELTVADPVLGPFQNNGGPTRTMSPTPGSPALDVGSNAALTAANFGGTVPTTDQRGAGFLRVSNGIVDLGAVELQVPVKIGPAGTNQFAQPGVPFALTGGQAGTPYTLTLAAAGPPAPYTFTLAGGALPPGLSLGSNGTISGTPTTAGTFNFQVTATNGTTPTPESGTAAFAITITPAAGGGGGGGTGGGGGGTGGGGGGTGGGGGGTGGGTGGGGGGTGGTPRVTTGDSGGAGPGGKVVVASGRADGTAQVYDLNSVADANLRGGAFTAFAGFTGVVRGVAADVNGDGVPDTILGTGPGGGSAIRVVNGTTGTDIAPTFSAFEPAFTGGVYIAAADIDGDGKAEVIVSPDQGGGGRVVIYSLVINGISAQMVLRANFFGIDDTAFRGGARVSAGDVNGDGVPDLVVGAGFGGGPRVAVFDGNSLLSGGTPTRLVNDFFAFPGSDAVTLRNGVFVTAGDFNGDGKADLAFGGGPGGGPRVLIVSGDLLRQGLIDQAENAPIANFFAFDETQRGGIRVAAKEADGDAFRELVVGSGDGQVPILGVYRGSSIAAGNPQLVVQNPFGDPVEANGVYVG